MLEEEEEIYFNGGSDEEEPAPIWIRGTVTGTMKMKRSRGASGEGNASSPNRQGPIVVPSPPMRLGGLVDYDGDDDELAILPVVPEPGPSRFNSNIVVPIPGSPGATDKNSVPVSPERRFARTPSVHRLRQAAAASASASPNNASPTEPGPGSPELSSGASPPSLRMSEKRRRNDDDDDEMLGLLSKGKRPALDADKTDSENVPPKTSTAVSPVAGPTKEDGGKKIKLTLKSGSRIAAGAASPVPTPSDTNTKDADQG